MWEAGVFCVVSFHVFLFARVEYRMQVSFAPSLPDGGGRGGTSVVLSSTL